MASVAADIKDGIKDKLEALVTGVAPNTVRIIPDVQVDDFKVSPVFDREIQQTPAAIITGPSMESAPHARAVNQRIYTYAIILVFNAENVEDTDIEDTLEIVLDAFDNDPTLGGICTGGLEPASTIPEPVIVKSKTYIMATVLLKAKTLKQLSY